MTNRIWIELDKPKNDAHGQEQVRLANNMLRRLLDMPKGEPPTVYFEYAGGKYHYGNITGTIELADNGHWMNLDYLGRD